MKTRALSQKTKIGVYYDYYGNPTDQVSTLYIENSQLYSTGHYLWQDPPDYRDIGGNFKTVYNITQLGTTGVGEIHGGSSAYTRHHYTGSVNGVTPKVPINPIGDGSDFGASAYNRMKPTKPTFPGLNAIYELREVPEMLRQRMLQNNLKNISSYWLALKFGWAPLLSDILSVVQFQRNAQKKLAWLLKHNGRPVRTALELFNNTSTRNSVTTTADVPGPAFVSYFYAKPSVTTFWTDTSDRCWAKAQWRYWLPPGPQDVNWTRSMMARLFGLYPSPSVVWKALPWTWLSDWFFSVGDQLSNLEAGVADKCAADRFYMMRQIENTCRSETTATYFDRFTNAQRSITVGASRVSGVKTRTHGDPFGFGTQYNSLNATQLSILGALGVSHL